MRRSRTNKACAKKGHTNAMATSFCLSDFVLTEPGIKQPLHRQGCGRIQVLVAGGCTHRELESRTANAARQKKCRSVLSLRRIEKRGGNAVTTLLVRLPAFNQKRALFHVGEGPTPALRPGLRGAPSALARLPLFGRGTRRATSWDGDEVRRLIVQSA